MRHIVRPGTIKIDQGRIEVLKNVGYPTKQTKLRSFLGLCNVYRCFVLHAKLAQAMNQPLENVQTVQLGELSGE